MRDGGGVGMEKRGRKVFEARWGTPAEESFATPRQRLCCSMRRREKRQCRPCFVVVARPKREEEVATSSLPALRPLLLP